MSLFLENYWNRDLLFRLIQYLLQLIAGWSSWLGLYPGLSRRALLISQDFGNMRVITRMMDDALLLTTTQKAFAELKQVGWRNIALLHFISALSFQLYYPLEHLAWMADHKILLSRSHSEIYWSSSCGFWGIAILFSLFAQMFILWQSWKKKQLYARAKKEDTGDHTVDMQQIDRQIFFAFLTVVQNFFDLLIAMDCTWTFEKTWNITTDFQNILIGLCGTVTSLIGIIKLAYF